MSVSTGTMNALKMAAGWCLSAVLIAGTLTYRDTLFPPGDAASEPSAARQETVNAAPQRRPDTAKRAAVVDDEPASRLGSERRTQIRAGANGHHEVRADINGRSVDVLVDTGATVVAMSYADGRTAGLRLLDSDFTHQVRTANGTARVARVILNNVSIGDVSVYDVPAVVFEENNTIGTTLLGMSFLGRLRKFEIQQGILTLIE